MRSQLTRLHSSLRALSGIVARGGLKDSGKIERRLGRLEEHYPQGWSMLERDPTPPRPAVVVLEQGPPAGSQAGKGAYLLRTNFDPMDPDALWRQYVQLTEVEPLSVPSKANWLSVRSSTASSAASRPIS